MERSTAPSKLFLSILFFLQLVLLSQLLEARTLGDAYGHKSLLTSDGGDHDHAVLLLYPDHLIDIAASDDGALERPSKRTPPSPKPRPSPHPALVGGCGAQRPPAPPLVAAAAPPRDHSGQQPVGYIGWQGRMKEVFRAFLQAN